MVQALGNWAARWVLEDPRPSELDPDLLMLWISRHRHRDLLPSQRVVTELALGDTHRRHYWLVLQADEISLCLKHPGFDPNLQMTADIAALYQVYLGRMSLAEALRDGLVLVEGPPALVRRLAGWFAWSSFAPAARAAAGRARAEASGGQEAAALRTRPEPVP